MADYTHYRDLCPLFDERNAGSGVIHPFYVPGPANATSTGLDLDSSDDITVKFPFKIRLVTCTAIAVADAQGLKTGAASTEPILAVTYAASASATWNSAGDGTEIALITCDGTGDYGKVWTGTTTATDIEAMAPIGVYVKTAGSSATSGNIDGLAMVILWYSQLSGPD